MFAVRQLRRKCGLMTSSFSTSSRRVEMGDKVRIRMEGKLLDGNLFDSHSKENPLGFTVGNGEMIQGVEEAVIGMEIGATKSFTVPPEKGFGMRNELHKVTMKRGDLQLSQEEQDQLQTGAALSFGTGHSATVTDLTKESISLDLNHPLSGKDLEFEIELVEHKKLAELSPAEKPVVPTESTQSGDGKTFPKRGDRLRMHYVGTLTDGTVFDSSRERNQPFEFQIGVGQVIRGWDEGVLRMSVGQRAKLYIPSVKGYGKRGAGEVIPPDADLIFDVELLEIL